MRRGGSPRRRERGRRRGIGRGARAGGGEHDSRRPNRGRQLDTSATTPAPTVPQHSTHANLHPARRGRRDRRTASAHPERLGGAGEKDALREEPATRRDEARLGRAPRVVAALRLTGLGATAVGRPGGEVLRRRPSRRAQSHAAARVRGGVGCRRASCAGALTALTPHSRPLPVPTIPVAAEPCKKPSRVQGTSGALRQSAEDLQRCDNGCSVSY